MPCAGVADGIFHVLDAGLDGIVVRWIVGDELFEAEVSAAADGAAATHHGVTAALHQFVALLVAIEAVDRDGT